ncbi:MAG: ASKHA domain-containing protein, partial [Bdellovibrionales bacterium]|nr:ASKHA domain-containing protein [Bdellovibrionales bacterium]
PKAASTIGNSGAATANRAELAAASGHRVLAHQFRENLHFSENVFPPRLACDLGSTGVVVSLLGADGVVVREAHLLNRQISFGADVMTRLQKAQENGVAKLQLPLFETIEKCVAALKKWDPELVQAALTHPIICSGNSAMASFLHGWPIESLATSPFQPFKKTSERTVWKDLTVETPPLLAGFVGADTFAALVWLESQNFKKPWMLVDIGTNTEIVIMTPEGSIWCSSAPAGPAFEGGNITRGMRAEPGAISVAKYQSGKWELEVLGNDRAIGMCGSGLIDAIAESLDGGLIQSDGLTQEPVELTEGVELFQDDIREFQLAKSATRTACEILMERAGVKIETLFLAGTFAEHLRLESVERVGLLPQGIPIQKVGNASLKGSLLMSLESRENVFRQNLEKRIAQDLVAVELALQDDFQERFVRNLNF